MMVLPKLDLKRLGETMSAAVLRRRRARDHEEPMDAAALDAALDERLSREIPVHELVDRRSRTKEGVPVNARAPRSLWSTQAARPPQGVVAEDVAAPDVIASGVIAPRVMKSVRQSGLWRTARAATYERELEACTPQLRVYLAVLVRSHERAERSLEILRELLEQGEGRDLGLAPGTRARLFLLARRAALPDVPVNVGIEHAPWDAVPPGRPAGYGRVLDLARGLVSLVELEMLLLTTGLGLSNDEAACVLDIAPTEVERRRESTRAWIALQLEEESSARGLDPDEVIADALRVLPPPETSATSAGPPRPLPSGSVIAGRYEIESVVGGGAFGHVYRARDRRVHTHVVALKVAHRASLTEAAKEGALAELSRIASAFHPSLVQLKEHGWHDERLWFAMPFYEGETLAERVARSPLTPVEAAEVLAPIAEALACLHRAGIRHQDVKPDNIFLAKLDDARTLPVLLDLGVAARADDLAVAGTPAFFAPEVARRLTSPDDHVAIDDRADVFALGLTFAQSIAPSIETEEDDLDAFLRQRAEASPTITDGRLKGIKKPLSRWLAASAKERPDASSLASELHHLRASASTKTRGSARTALAMTLLLAVVVLAVAALAISEDPSLLATIAPQTSAPEPVVVAPSLVTNARTLALEERVEAAEARARALQERLSSCE
ncbi:MAG: serine/threonine protein kinase [Deltaproteobacteria bacterium]|nr:serine/threonine protein kinase [Deltaproteobacteria bacterium]